VHLNLLKHASTGRRLQGKPLPSPYIVRHPTGSDGLQPRFNPDSSFEIDRGDRTSLNSHELGPAASDRLVASFFVNANHVCAR